jgi:hypothetical protein
MNGLEIEGARSTPGASSDSRDPNFEELRRSLSTFNNGGFREVVAAIGVGITSAGVKDVFRRYLNGW